MFDPAGKTLIVRLEIFRNISGHRQWDIRRVHSDIGPRGSPRRMNTVRMVDLNIHRSLSVTFAANLTGFGLELGSCMHRQGTLWRGLN